MFVQNSNDFRFCLVYHLVVEDPQIKTFQLINMLDKAHDFSHQMDVVAIIIVM